MNGEASKKISITSGHGIGKSAIMAMLILRFLTCYADSEVPCTAPTQSQMYDVLWKEIAVWMNRMPERMQEKFELSADYLKVLENPKIWWARAKTARKENPEALAGIHAKDVFMAVDEASAVPDEIYISSK